MYNIAQTSGFDNLVKHLFKVSYKINHTHSSEGSPSVIDERVKCRILFIITIYVLLSCCTFITSRHTIVTSRHTIVCRAAKEAGAHTVAILTGRKKTSFSHFRISVIPYPIGNKFAAELPASQGGLHTKFEGNRSSHFRDTSCQSFDFFLPFYFLRVFAHLQKLL